MEKVFWFALVAVVLSLALVVCAFAVYGDIYKDGKVNANDAVKLAQKLAKWDIEFTAEDEKNADVFYDGVLNAADAVKLAQFLAGWDVKLGPKGEDVEIDGDDLFDETTGEAGTTAPVTTAPAPDTTVPEDTTTTVPEPEPEPNTGRLPFSKGINVDGLQDFSDGDYDRLSQYLDSFTSENTYKDIKSKGFDHVRISVNLWRAYLDDKDKYTTEEFMGFVDTAINHAMNNGLYVMLSFHGWFNIGDKATDIDECLYIWNQVAERYKDYDTKLMFEPLNEPWYDNGKARPYLSDNKLNELQANIISIIRSKGSNNATRLIICCTADGNKAWKLDKLVLPDDDNLAVAIHEYEPKAFTHQNFSWAGYGGKTTSLDAAGGIAATDWDFSQIKKFMDKTGIPVVLNEFGMNLAKSPEADVKKYLEGIVDACEELDIPWAIWQYYGGGYSSEGAMSLYRKSSLYGNYAWDQKALDALFSK